MSIGAWIGLGIGAFVIITIIAIFVWYVSTFNKFVRLKNNAEEGFSTMDVCMKERYDLIPNVVETVKGYAKHEKETLTNVIEARNKAISATTTEEKMKAEGDFSKVMSKLLMLTENYPELKANANFSSLQDQLANLETKIANSRKYYNACVKEFNILVESFPSNIVANSKGYKKMQMFEIPEEHRENVKVQF
jgi:LemA protein